MKRIIFLFLTIYTFAFSISDFPTVKWMDREFDILLSFPGVKEETSYFEDVKILSKEDPKESVSFYKFYLKNDQLYKIEVIFDSSKVGKNELNEIYGTLEKTMGNPVSSDPIDIKLENISLNGNSITFIPDDETIVLFKGLDTLDKSGKMIDSQLILEYRDKDMANIVP